MDALFVVANLPLAVMLLAIAVLTFRTACLPAWLGWLAVLAAGTQLIPVCGIVIDGGSFAADGWVSAYLPYPLYAVWLASTVVATTIRVGKTQHPTVASRRSARAAEGGIP